MLPQAGAERVSTAAAGTGTKRAGGEKKDLTLRENTWEAAQNKRQRE